MPLRSRLPVISPSAVPAPKYSGGQRYGPRRPSFWKSECDQYWEKCRRNKRSARRKAMRILVVVVGVAALLLLVARLRRSPKPAEDVRIATRDPTIATRDASIVTRDAAIATRDAAIATRDATIASQGTSTNEGSGVSDGLRLKTLACVGSSTKHDLESKTCAKMCAKARTTAPRPLAHRSCLAGCRAGVTTAWDTACVGGRHRDCVRESTERCDFHCASYRNQFPKPTIFNKCLRSCMDVVETTCLRSKEVFAAVEVPGEASAVGRKRGRK